MNIIQRLLAKMRRDRFARNIEREIHHGIFPHIKGRADHGYPFSSKDELHKVRLKGSIEMWKTLRELDSAALKMSEKECNAFLYIVNRDLEERLRMYLKYINAHPKAYAEPEFQPVAVPA